MKHNFNITLILLSMFIVTQLIGIYVIDYYSPVKVINGKAVEVGAPTLPYGMASPKVENESDYLYVLFPSIIIAFILAIALMLFLSKFKADIILKLWFFFVVLIALGIALNAILPKGHYASIIAILIALPLGYLKIFKQNYLIHNLTELLIYPGIAAVFVPILDIWSIIILLILISVYDMWAVWHSGIMQKMAKYQMNQLKVFSGFFIPYLSKNSKQKLKKLKKSNSKNKTVKANVAILGGGDVIFPIITAGVVLKTFGFLPAVFVIIGSTIGLAYLFVLAEKKKFYPAMPFITTGIFLGIIASRLLALW